MATILLSAAGAAIGSSIGGGILGLSSAVIGRAVGATVGRIIDQRILGAGSEAIETGKVDRFRIMGASEGAAIPQVYGRMRVAGQVIWASRFLERVRTSGGSGKGIAPSAPKVRTSSYSVSLAVALCEGEISGIGRVWADGIELAHNAISVRVYPGDEDQLPDPRIETIEGVGQAPAYRGLAYVVIDDMELGPFGNRVPQLSFEVIRPEARTDNPEAQDIARGTRAVALMPGTGEYALSTTPVYVQSASGKRRAVNVNSLWGRTDFAASLAAMDRELPECEAVSLIVSWFGNDLRCGECRVRPKVEETGTEIGSVPWRVSGVMRPDAQAVPRVDDRPIYGGAPTDASVIQAIQALKAAGKAVMFYPFLLMDQIAGNDLPDPWSDAQTQPALPWRGRITTSVAPGRAGSTDRTAAATGEVAQFFGTAVPGDLTWDGTRIVAGSGADWRYRRFILHYARLCAAAGGVEAFCIGSEMRSLTQIRDGDGGYPAVAAFRALLADVRAILGPSVKLSYAADWSEYFGHHPQDGSGDVIFHLDPLWADANTDFVGIDNYMPLSDWRDGEIHADAGAGSIYDLGYLRGNVAGGEGYDWYYHAPEAEAAQNRTPITDGAYGEPWVFRYKDIRSWWSNVHHDRPGGIRSPNPTAWVPGSKPIWFTEYGCPAVDKGTNEPNRFVDPKSSESFLPKYSDGRRDDAIQMCYLQAVRAHWSDPANNPVSDHYGGPMVDLSRAFVWAYDARPFPAFPANLKLWSDGENYARGHWLNGRASSRSLAGVVREICARAGVPDVDVTRLHGLVRGYAVPETGSARESLQQLMLSHGFDAVERGGVLSFRTRSAWVDGLIDPERVVAADAVSDDIVLQRAPEAETASRVRTTYVEAEREFAVRTSEAANPAQEGRGVAQASLALLLTSEDARSIVERWLAEAVVASETVRLGLPPSVAAFGPGDVLEFSGARYRIDRMERGEGTLIEAVRTEPSVFSKTEWQGDLPAFPVFAASLPVDPLFLDLPRLADGQVEHAPVAAIAADPWPGEIAVYRSAGADGYELNTLIDRPAVVGETWDVLPAARSDLWDRGPAVRVRLQSGPGGLSSASPIAVLNGANLAAIGDGSPGGWEVFQFSGAELVEPSTYALTGRLRGLAGTDAVMPDAWPAGSRFVLLTSDLTQLEHPLALRGLSRRYRIGPADLSIEDPVYMDREEAFEGIGLRPLSPVHLSIRQVASGLRVTWIRRTRIGGDSWIGPDVPLGELTELYLLRVRQGGAITREVMVQGATDWTYSSAMQVADGVSAPFDIEVAQVSDIFGPGPATRITQHA
jgi:hypothetical protein